MRKILSFILILLMITSHGFTEQWDKDGIDPDNNYVDECFEAAEDNNIALDRMLKSYRQGVRLEYDSASQLTVKSGEIMVSNSGGTVRLMLNTTTDTTVTWADIDTGTEASSTTYYVYAGTTSTSAETTTFKISTNATTPTGLTYFKRIGQFFNDSGSDIDQEKLLSDQDIGDNSVTSAMLKTASGEVSASSSQNVTLPGGTYGFFPQLKASGGLHHINVGGWSPNGGQTLPSTYTTILGFALGTGTVYAKQRYVTASGIDYWIMLLTDKEDNIVASYAAPDHPCYGNGGDADLLPHPFIDFNNEINNIYLVEKECSQKLLMESKLTNKSILDLVVNDYKVNKKDMKYVPLHSGLFVDKKPEYIYFIPGYIKVRALSKLSKDEKKAKDEKENKQSAINLKLAQFDPIKVKAELFDLFENNLEAFSPIYVYMDSLLSYKDFMRLKRYLDGLLKKEKITQELYNSFYQIILKNGIDLNEY